MKPIQEGVEKVAKKQKVAVASQQVDKLLASLQASRARVGAAKPPPSRRYGTLEGEGLRQRCSAPQGGPDDDLEAGKGGGQGHHPLLEPAVPHLHFVDQAAATPPLRGPRGGPRARGRPS